MPGARYHASFELPTCQRRTLVWAKIVDREILVATSKDGDYAIANFVRPTLTVGNVTDFGNCDVIVGLFWLFRKQL